jgi:hypothetical protein
MSASFETPRFSIHMTTDPSLEGWAAVVGDAAFSGTWDEEDGEDIALLEMKAVLLGLQVFFECPAPLTIHLSTDNTVTKAYINHMGGKIPCYDALARCIRLFFLEECNVFLVAFYVPSAENQTDELTRLEFSCRSDRIIASEFKLLPRWFHAACAELKISPDIDWFASDATPQLDRFCAWESSADASLFDAFVHSWKNDVGYFFPPFSLLPRVLAKIKHDHAHGLLVVPHWEGASWWRPLMNIKKAVFKVPQLDPIFYPAKPTLQSRKQLELWLISF